MWATLVLCSSVTLFVAVHGWPSQVPPKACPTMTPVHPNEKGEAFKPQPLNTFPYKIQITGQKGPNSPITVSLTGNSANQIQGFQIQARDVNTNAIVGQFRETNDKNIQFVGCDGNHNTASHTSKDNKPRVTAVWQPNNYKGSIQFFVTALKTYDVFWVGKKTDVVNIS